jgi:hypothetical protein
MGLKALLLAACVTAVAAGPGPIHDELRRLGADTALVLPSQSIDGAAIWSPDSRYVAAEVAGTWYQVDLQRISLGEAKWHGGQVLGVNEREGSVSPLPPSSVEQWKPKTKPGSDIAAPTASSSSGRA